jgi:hypothetical protein
MQSPLKLDVIHKVHSGFGLLITTFPGKVHLQPGNFPLDQYRYGRFCN